MKLPLCYEAVLHRTLLGLNLSNELEGFEPIIEEKSFYSTDHSETIGPADKAGVSSYTSRADKAGNDLG